MAIFMNWNETIITKLPNTFLVKMNSRNGGFFTPFHSTQRGSDHRTVDHHTAENTTIKLLGGLSGKKTIRSF